MNKNMNEKREYIEYYPIAEINGIKFHKESDMLKWYKENIGFGVIEDEMIMEEYQINNSFDTHVLGGCYNSIPYFLRMQERREGRVSWFEGSLNKHASVLVEGTYEELCSKVAWGSLAYIASHTRLDNEQRIRILPGNKHIEDVFSSYLTLCKNIYRAINQDDYDYCQETRDKKGIDSLDQTFYEQHLQQEESLITRTLSTIIPTLGKNIDEAIFDGNLHRLAKEYIKWVNETINARNIKCSKGKNISFRAIIQYKDPDALLERLHQLIDGRRGADVGSVIQKAKMDGYLSRYPKKAEFISEFELLGTWQGINNYFNENDNKCLGRSADVMLL